MSDISDTLLLIAGAIAIGVGCVFCLPLLLEWLDPGGPKG